jgi:hypothetical protein
MVELSLDLELSRPRRSRDSSCSGVAESGTDVVFVERVLGGRGAVRSGRRPGAVLVHPAPQGPHDRQVNGDALQRRYPGGLVQAQRVPELVGPTSDGRLRFGGVPRLRLDAALLLGPVLVLH